MGRKVKRLVENVYKGLRFPTYPRSFLNLNHQTIYKKSLHIYNTFQLDIMTDAATIAFYKGESQDFLVFVESEQAVQDYLKDSTIPLVDAVGTFKVYTSESGRGVDGVLHEAAKRDLENQFGKVPKEEIIEKILKEGEYQKNKNIGKKSWGSTNDANGVNH